MDQSSIPVGLMNHLSYVAQLEQENELLRTAEPHSDHFCRNVLLIGMVALIFLKLLKIYIAREIDNGPRVLS